MCKCACVRRACVTRGGVRECECVSVCVSESESVCVCVCVCLCVRVCGHVVCGCGRVCGVGSVRGARFVWFINPPSRARQASGVQR